MRIPWFKRKTNPNPRPLGPVKYIPELWAPSVAEKMGGAMSKSMDGGLADLSDDLAADASRFVRHNAIIECTTCLCLVFKSRAHQVDIENDFIQLFQSEHYCGACAPAYDFVRVSADNKLRKYFKYAQVAPEPEPGMIEVREDGRPMPKRRAAHGRRRRTRR